MTGYDCTNEYITSTDSGASLRDLFEEAILEAEEKSKKEARILSEKDYTPVIERAKLKPLPEHKQPVLRRKTARSLLAPLPNKGWKGGR